MNTLLVVFIALFALSAGFGLGAGNYKGLIGAIIPGIAAGLLAAIPAIHESEWTIALVMVGAAIVGSLICSLTSDQNRIKRFCRNQSNLVIRAGSYKLGINADEKSGQSDEK